MYTLKQAKEDHKNGWLDGFCLRQRIGEGWYIEVYQGKNVNERIVRPIFKARNEIRIFKTADSALKAIYEIGFSTTCLTGIY